ncbi:hypothetical protein CWS01_21490 [Niallia nealsonii]|uniref:Uncharacterized protein n=1 Tax=Niallia nealsonii TaxID=115979 RepID=A0A2N0YWI1_9BACI|nr:hypothetical protein CWS01_21490 [Niallia nealsonii]
MRDSCGISGTGETPQAIRQGGSPPAPRKASILERKSTYSFKSKKVYENSQQIKRGKQKFSIYPYSSLHYILIFSQYLF